MVWSVSVKIVMKLMLANWIHSGCVGSGGGHQINNGEDALGL